MKKFVIITLLSLLIVGIALPQAKPGGIARQAAMGGSMAGFNLVMNPFIMEDPALLLVNPAYQDMYNDYLWANIAGGNIFGSYYYSGENGYGHQNAGISFSISDNFTLGMVLSYDPSASFFVDTLTRLYPGVQRYPQSIPHIENVWEVIAAYKFSSMTLGLGVMYGSSNDDYNYDQKAPSYKNEEVASSSMFGVRAGAIMDMGENLAMDFSGALRMDNTTDKVTYSPTINGQGGTYEASATEIQLSARAKFKMSNKFNFVPYGMFTMLSAEPTEETPPIGLTSAAATQEYSSTVFALGIGGEYRTQSFYFAGGISFQYGNMELDQKAPDGQGDTVKSTMSYTGLPVLNLGGEWWVTSWMAARMGYYRSIASINQKYETPNYTSEYNWSAPNSMISLSGLNQSTYDGLVTLGVGFKFGGFALDATISEEALRRGLGLIGGGDDNINTFGYLTASFNFAE